MDDYSESTAVECTNLLYSITASKILVEQAELNLNDFTPALADAK
jgi:hypothetical protein